MPVLNLGSVVFGLMTLFLEPNPDDPLNKGTFVKISVGEGKERQGKERERRREAKKKEGR